jgi:hypothetical protein
MVSSRLVSSSLMLVTWQDSHAELLITGYRDGEPLLSWRVPHWLPRNRPSRNHNPSA